MTSSKHHYLVIMAGGSGTRLWPLSTVEKPKQFLNLQGNSRTLIQETLERVASVFPKENIYVYTNQRYRRIVLNQLVEYINEDQVVLEPIKRNTAPCLLLASMKIFKRDKEAKMVVLPSDHLIKNKTSFIKDIQFALSQADQEKLITFGIEPNYPSTDYGYIKTNQNERFSKVLQFTEKPKSQKAISYLMGQRHLWNAGIFVWKASVFLNEFLKCQPEMYSQIQKGYHVLNLPSEESFLAKNYPKLKDISIDYALLELSESVYVLKASFDWTDLGNWKSVYDVSKKDKNKNVLMFKNGNLVNNSNSLVRVEGHKKILISGLKDYIVVDTDEGLLICPKHELERIKKKL
ncbi:MAG: mannose-1-phosphate guanylyltransferase [Flavobacteriaceae bacterium]|nr:mannose-1-phosphate guanylyltransferase [Flavobacteriaceae bacterium]MCY4267200.1 mannose-1-phosphate guanylyltransferase [Flavobacteriaceae bacterium]MCY4298646.1 mannose-1-phosphate guanylyltransferase [Flavobacteriaceae bacterium]